MIYDDYIDYTETYQQKYGEQTVVFMQVGDFFEMYAVNNDHEKVGADIYTVCDLCNIQVSRKNKSILENSRQNPLMAGFPIAIVSKHIQTLVQHQYTVILIRQVTPPPNPKREVTEIISPSTHTQPQGNDNTFLMTLYWENHPVHYQSNQRQWSVGMCCIDVTTGDVLISEAFPKLSDKHYAKDEAYRWIQSIQPKEIVFVGETVPMEYLQELYQDLQVSHLKIYRTVHEQWGHEQIPIYKKTSYQEQTLSKIYGSQYGLTGILEAFDLDRCELTRMAMMFAIQFIYDHNEKMVQCLKPPQNYEGSNYLNIHYNALLQLNVISNVPGEKPLLSLLNRCATAFGSRLFKEQLLNPILSMDTLNKRYNTIEEWMGHPELATIRKTMGSIFDLERFARRLLLEQLAPCEWVSIASSLEACVKMIQLVKSRHNPDASTSISSSPIHRSILQIQQLVESIQTIMGKYLVLEEASKYWLNDIRGSVFCPNIYKELDHIQTGVEHKLKRLQTLADTLSSYMNEQSICKLECNDREGYYLAITKKRWETILSRVKPDMAFTISNDNENTDIKSKSICIREFKTKPVSSTSSILKITHNYIDYLSHSIIVGQKKLGVLATECYMDFLKTIKQSVSQPLVCLVSLLAEMDISITHAKNALDYSYTRPILDTSKSKSYVQASKLRHPIIERIQTQISYVPNDIELGLDKDGWLLYGINASGKSSLMKAIGLNIIMAQAGSFVPCESMTLHPYEYIFTRIAGSDNIYRGMSSFTVEMTELRNILMRCNEHSLVLGDELCAGTEALSALSIVASGIETLAEKKVSFVFATHLHELLDLGCIPQNVDIYHIHIEIDPDSGSIVYDRHLTKGSGHAYYGLEVCKALQLPDAFIRKAHGYRRKIQEESSSFLNTKTSHYNKGLFMDKCHVCGKTSTETHHILYQQNATSKKHVGHVGLHSPANLVPLCDECHLKEHHGEIKIEGYCQTSKGKKLKISKKDK
jgi:DNA mismatch repair protein MutS